MSFREGVSASRRLHLGLPADLEAEFAAFARRHGLSLGAAIRLLGGRALRAEVDSRPSGDSMVALAALIAAEHAVLMVASVLPEGQRRKQELSSQAAIEAQARLDPLQESED